jgi:hypothetical protein
MAFRFRRGGSGPDSVCSLFGDGPHDYTLSIGISDACRVDDMSLRALLKDNRHLVNVCDFACAFPTAAVVSWCKKE